MFNEVVKIGKKKIGRDKKIYIIGDVGLTNNGSLKDAFKLINILSNFGVDAVKFQMIGPDILLGDKKISYTYPTLKNGIACVTRGMVRRTLIPKKKKKWEHER